MCLPEDFLEWLPSGDSFTLPLKQLRTTEIIHTGVNVIKHRISVKRKYGGLNVRKIKYRNKKTEMQRKCT